MCPGVLDWRGCPRPRPCALDVGDAPARQGKAAAPFPRVPPGSSPLSAHVLESMGRGVAVRRCGIGFSTGASRYRRTGEFRRRGAVRTGRPPVRAAHDETRPVGTRSRLGVCAGPLRISCRRCLFGYVPSSPRPPTLLPGRPLLSARGPPPAPAAPAFGRRSPRPSYGHRTVRNGLMERQLINWKARSARWGVGQEPPRRVRGRTPGCDRAVRTGRAVGRRVTSPLRASAAALPPRTGSLPPVEPSIHRQLGQAGSAAGRSAPGRPDPLWSGSRAGARVDPRTIPDLAEGAEGAVRLRVCGAGAAA